MGEIVQDIFRLRIIWFYFYGPRSYVVGIMKLPSVQGFPICEHACSFRTDSWRFIAFTVADLAPVTSPIHEKRSLRPICRDPIIQSSRVTLPAASTPGPSHPLALRCLCLFIPTWVRNVFFFLQDTGFVLPLFSPSNSLCPKLTTFPRSQEHTVYLFSMFKAAKGF